MGLCKCPKKKVTNLFCFEHRVNVCEHCLVDIHPNCVVQSYLSWLKDSDYDSSCILCSLPLAENETVRLQCLHLFHWKCLDSWARNFPANTAPAGFKCQICQTSIFPSANQVSPIIENLRSILQKSNWARAGLGLSLLPELENLPPSKELNSNMNHLEVHQLEGSSNVRSSSQAIAVDVDEMYNKNNIAYFNARKIVSNENDQYDYDERNALVGRTHGFDDDSIENKYKRRSATEWLTRWLRSRYHGRSPFDPRARCKRLFLMLFIGLVAIITIFTILQRILGGPENDDPAFDPRANPNIRIAALQDAAFN